MRYDARQTHRGALNDPRPATPARLPQPPGLAFTRSFPVILVPMRMHPCPYIPRPRSALPGPRLLSCFLIAWLTACSIEPTRPETTARSSEPPSVLVHSLGEEIQIAHEQIDFALRRPSEPRWVERHARFARHALAPDTEPELQIQGGPGLGIGIQALVEALSHRQRIPETVPAGRRARAPRSDRKHRPAAFSTILARISDRADLAVLLCSNVIGDHGRGHQIVPWLTAAKRTLEAMRDQLGRARIGPRSNHAGPDLPSGQAGGVPPAPPQSSARKGS